VGQFDFHSWCAGGTFIYPEGTRREAGLIKEIATALRKAPQPRPLRIYQRAVMLLLSVFISLPLGWCIVAMLQGKHYVIFAFAAFPLFVIAKIGGLLLRGSIMPTPPS